MATKGADRPSIREPVRRARDQEPDAEDREVSDVTVAEACLSEEQREAAWAHIVRQHDGALRRLAER